MNSWAATPGKEESMRHTKEPWSFSEGVGMLKGPDGRYIIGTTENNRRIVACVNACAGIENEVLEFDQPQFVAMLQQRAELLAALEGVLPFLTGNYWPGAEADAAVDRAVAIARAAAMRPNAKAVGLDAAGGQSHTSDGLCGAGDTEKET